GEPGDGRSGEPRMRATTLPNRSPPKRGSLRGARRGATGPYSPAAREERWKPAGVSHSGAFGHQAARYTSSERPNAKRKVSRRMGSRAPARASRVRWAQSVTRFIVD